MISTKPYLVRAIHEWCIDQGLTPHLAVHVDGRTVVPPGYASDGQIVLNVGPDATSNLVMGNDLITFQARFGGAVHSLRIPVANVLAVYARENGHGMAFEPEAAQECEIDDDLGSIVPGAEAGDDAGAAESAGSSPGDDDPVPPAPRRGHLKVVK